MIKKKKHGLGQRTAALLLAFLLAFGALLAAPAFAQTDGGIAVPQENTEPAVPDNQAATEAAFPAEEKAEAAAQPDGTDTTAGQAAKALTVLHTNDMHGALVSSGTSTIGADETAGIRETTEKAENTLLVDAGDATQGGTLAALSQGADVITLMNAAKYDAMALGNHEFDYGQEVLLANVRNADFPVLSANTVYKDTGRPILEGVAYAGGTQTNNGQYTLIEKNGIKVGIFGVTTPETATKTNPKGIEGIEFRPVAPAAEEMITVLKAQGAEVIICLAHLGVDPSTIAENSSVGLAKALGPNSGLDMIIDGHSHTVYSETVNGILIEQTGSSSKNIGKINVTMDNGTNTVSGKLIDAETAFKDYRPDPAVTSLADQLVAVNEEKLKPVIGNTRTALWGGWAGSGNIARIGEINMGNLIADSMVEEAKALLASDAYKDSPYKDRPVVALENGGGVRATIRRGDITVGDSINVLPFGNTLAFKAVTPAILYAALENGVSKVVSQDPATGQITGQGGCFPQISGMSFTYDPRNPARDSQTGEAGSRVTAIYLAGSSEPLRRDDTTTAIVLCSNDYELAGGDGYDMLVGLTSVGEGGSLEEVFRNHLTRLTEAGGGSFLAPTAQGRIRTVGAYEPKPYAASITVTGPGTLGSLAGKAVEYQIDGGAVQAGALDENGVLSFDLLPDGPHSIRIGDADDVLVNNYSGDTAVTAAVRERLTISETPQPKPEPEPVKPEAQEEPETLNPHTGTADRAGQAGGTALGLALVTAAMAAGVRKQRKQKAG
ncbi:5'-nucleotidase C-terminal domain-containing protein [Eubacterium sp. 1001713B170207_170306_E7]|uniref:bifunctional metallophosphatase/5'-nucleotidase n=1 Tax=Eubacterium sp. 1001713B170207_170306_E7 TaxID=2787097 RepID=UPI0018999B66|nr:5'-nucleotidase C-terminal domain-containing protein [Eubacterium sp. 1001713B170207_170306_E7]